MNKFFYQKTIINYGLLPLAGLYRGIIFLRRLFYQCKLFKTTRFDVPLVMVGNLTVGGTGKTPLVIYLVNLLKQQGFRPGVVSRGYGGKAAHYPLAVTAESNPACAGDEPVLIARQTSCPVYVAPDRVAAVRQLLNAHNCNVIISDDGLQHYALARDIEIVLIDGVRRFGNGYCLPAGPLREPVQRLKSVDFIINNGATAVGEYAMQLIPQAFLQVNNPQQQRDTTYFKSKTIHAVAGIGHPPRFFAQLCNMGLTIIEHAFPDHHAFTKADFLFAKDDTIIMTEKDAVKCRAFATEQYWYLPVLTTVEEKFCADFLEKVNSLSKIN